MSARDTTGVCSRCAERTRLSVRLCPSTAGRTQSICRHHCLFPERLRAEQLAPDLISVQDSAERLHALLAKKVVAIVGTRAPSDYGERIAQALTRDLAVSGVAIAGIEDGIGGGACVWAHEAGGSALVVEAWETAPSVERYPSNWPASERALALLADLMIVVEAGEGDLDYTSAEEARSRGVPVAAVPGPVDSASSLASNTLIAEGIKVICHAQDALDALYGVGRRRTHWAHRPKPRKRQATIEPSAQAKSASAFKPPPGLEPELAAVLERVGSGEDTLAKLCAGMETCGELTLALTELELFGLLRREQDGRYTVS